MSFISYNTSGTHRKIQEMKKGDTVKLMFKGEFKNKGFINILLGLNDPDFLIGLNTDGDVLYYASKHIVLMTRVVLFEKYKK